MVAPQRIETRISWIRSHHAIPVGGGCNIRGNRSVPLVPANRAFGGQGPWFRPIPGTPIPVGELLFPGLKSPDTRATVTRIGSILVSETRSSPCTTRN